MEAVSFRREVQEQIRDVAEKAVGGVVPDEIRQRVYDLVQENRSLRSKVTDLGSQIERARWAVVREGRKVHVLLLGIEKEHGKEARALAARTEDNVILVPGVLLHDDPNTCGTCECGWHPVEVDPASVLFAHIERAAEVDRG